jgi:predicted TIM-barrel fold metal-dependent hydrolase
MASDRQRWLDADPLFKAMYSHPKARLATAEELVASMDIAGVDVSVILGFAWADSRTCSMHNDYLLEIAASSHGRLIPFCTVQPAAGVEALNKEISRCAGLGARGLGELRPDDQGFRIVDSDAGRALAEAARVHNLVLLFHVSEPVGHLYPGKAGLSLSDFATFAANNRTCKIVGAHWGGGLPFYSLMPEVKASHDTTWFDTAATRYLYDPAIYALGSRLAGAHRILFGSDFPLLGQKSTLLEIDRAELDPPTVAAIKGENAVALLGLK